VIVVPIFKANILVIVKQARHVLEGEIKEVEFINNKEEDAPSPPKIHIPM